ncbi:hypothetical protein D3C78_739200 [compost metagenome]
MGEIGTDRMPVSPQYSRTQTPHDPDRKLRSLTTAARQVADHFFTNDHRLARVFDMNRQRIIEQMPVLHDHQQGITQRALVTEQQADLAKVRQLAQFGHPQAKGLTTTDPRRFLQQGNHA